MAKFIKHNFLKNEIENIFKEAEDVIIIISPFIKLPSEIKRILEPKKKDSKFELLLMFGKNESDISKSLSAEDFAFLKGFKNLRIHYHKDLHAKYYANETTSIVTSINLHEYSFQNNIEVGMLMNRDRFSILGDNSMDTEAFDYFMDVFDSSKCVYEQSIKEKSTFFGLFKKEIGIDVIEDNSKSMYRQTGPAKNNSSASGYCIRTGKIIPFNTKHPFSNEAFKSWNQFKNKDFKEKYCHYSGEPSNGATSFSKPILAKNWKKAMT